MTKVIKKVRDIEFTHIRNCWLDNHKVRDLCHGPLLGTGSNNN